VTSALGNSDSDIKQLLTNFQETNRKAQMALDNFNKIFEGINEVVGDVEMKNRFRETLRKLPEVFDEVRNTIVNTRDTINSFREVSSKLGTNLDNLDGFTSSLKEVGPEILDQVYTSLQNIDQLVGQIRNFTGKIDQMQKGEGTVGKLLTDPTLYNNANEAVANVKELTYKLEPLVNDLRMFADSLARDPRQLGVRGAMDLRPLGTGYKGTVPGRQDQQPAGAEKSGAEIRR
jgi:phospholipid/cholesterol/gamma-HCH transport system substrate-binding protein